MRILRLISGLWIVSVVILTGLTEQAFSAPQTTLTIAIENEPAALDPRFGIDEYSEHVYQLVYNGLVQKDAHAVPIPDLAERWEIPDDTTYIFYLRKGVTFHDGSEFTAEDVKYTFDTLRDPALQSPKSGPYGIIADIAVIDPYTVKFTLRSAFSPFLMELTHPILPQKAVGALANKRFTNHLIGTGPFKLVEWKPGAQLIFERHPTYFEGVAKLEKILMTVIPDETECFRALQQGTVDFVHNSFSPQILALIAEGADTFQILKEPGEVVYYIGFNLQDPVLQNLKVRQAIAHAIDRQTMLTQLAGDHATLANSLLAPSNWAYEPDVTTYAHDLDKAKALLDEAGYPDPDGDGPQPRLTLIYKTSANSLRIAIGKILQEQVKPIGIDISEIQAFGWAQFNEDLKNGVFQVYALRWIGISEPDILHSIFHSAMLPPTGRNRGHYANAKLDELTTQGRRVMDLNERQTIYSDVQKILADELPYLLLWYPHNTVVMKNTLHGFTLYPDGDLASFKDVWFE